MAYELMLIPFSGGVNEASLFELIEDRVAVFYGSLAYPELTRAEVCAGSSVLMKVSKDHGRTWSDAAPLCTKTGEEIRGYRVSPFRLKSGAIGIMFTGPMSRTGRDGALYFSKSLDEGQTWSAGVPVDPFAVLRNGCTRVLRSGRIVAPIFKWISNVAPHDSELEKNNLCFTWISYSDDEGENWNRSLSELVVIKNEGCGGTYHFEEPVLEELKQDNRVLMYGRTELGRHYLSISEDGGIVWSTPQPGPLAAAYTPTLLRRIPKTDDLLIIWNQATPEEMFSGLSRHRLTAAISKDDGGSWKHFRNLESLNNVAQIDPPPIAPLQVYRRQSNATFGNWRDYFQAPEDKKRYPHAPGPLRICYPDVAFLGDDVLVAYDYSDNEAKRFSTKLRVLPLDWFYQS